MSVGNVMQCRPDECTRLVPLYAVRWCEPCCDLCFFVYRPLDLLRVLTHGVLHDT